MTDDDSDDAQQTRRKYGIVGGRDIVDDIEKIVDHDRADLDDEGDTDE